jgi:nicotinamidase-related amidase
MHAGGLGSNWRQNARENILYTRVWFLRRSDSIGKVYRTHRLRVTNDSLKFKRLGLRKTWREWEMFDSWLFKLLAELAESREEAERADPIGEFFNKTIFCILG